MSYSLNSLKGGVYRGVVEGLLRWILGVCTMAYNFRVYCKDELLSCLRPGLTRRKCLAAGQASQAGASLLTGRVNPTLNPKSSTLNPSLNPKQL